MKANITRFSDRELSNLVFNTEGLYIMRHTPSLFRFISDHFKYTETQLSVLKIDLAEDLKAELEFKDKIKKALVEDES